MAKWGHKMLNDDRTAFTNNIWRRHSRERRGWHNIQERQWEQYPEWRLSLVTAINHDYYYLLCIIIIVLPRLPLLENVGQAWEFENNVWTKSISTFSWKKICQMILTKTCSCFMMLNALYFFCQCSFIGRLMQTIKYTAELCCI